MPLYVAAFYLSLPLLVAASLCWGGTSERAVAIFYVLAASATFALRRPWSARYLSVETGVLVVDVLLLCALLWIAVRSGLWWTMVVAAFQVLAILAHFAKAEDRGLMRAGYSLMLSISAYPALFLLAIGIWQHHRRVKQLPFST